MSQAYPRPVAVARPTGFTLVELMIVVVIVAILASVAYPAYQEHVTKARRSDGQSFLMEVMSRQEQYYSNNNQYTGDLTDLGYGSNPASSPEDFYQVSAAACGGGLTECVALTADAQGVQANSDTLCQDLTLNSLGQKGISGGTGTAEECW